MAYSMTEQLHQIVGVKDERARSKADRHAADEHVGAEPSERGGR